MTVVESSQNCVIRYWENKVLSVCTALGQQLKTARQHGSTAGAALIGVHPSNIDGPNWGSLGLYKAPWKRPAFMLKNSACLWIQTVQEEYGLVRKLHVVSTNCRQSHVSGTEKKAGAHTIDFFFLLEKESISTQSYQSFYLKEKCMRRIWNSDLTVAFFYYSHWIFFPILSANRNNTLSVCTVCLAASFSLPFSRFESNAGLHFSCFPFFFFSWLEI